MVSKGGLGQDGSRLERGRRAAGGSCGTIRVQARAGTCMSTRIAPGCSERCDGVESLDGQWMGNGCIGWGQLALPRSMHEGPPALWLAGPSGFTRLGLEA